MNRISINPRICHGEPCVVGTRIPIHQIVGMLENGDSIEDLLSEYPGLVKEDILASLAYVATFGLFTPVDPPES